MAKTKSKAADSGQRRKRRSAEEKIADLEREIQRIRERAKARELEGSPAHRLTLNALRLIDKALNAAAEEDAGNLRHALADARKNLGQYLEEKGVRLPKARLPRGPRPKE
jgi:hypothetical protein